MGFVESGGFDCPCCSKSDDIFHKAGVLRGFVEDYHRTNFVYEGFRPKKFSRFCVGRGLRVVKVAWLAYFLFQ